MIRSGSICISFLYKYLLSESETNNGDELIKKSNKLKCLSDIFASYGGVLAKLSQILCLENQDSDVFSDCKPYCQKETIQYFREYYEKNPKFFKDVRDMDFNVFKSGSIGQVHKCKYKNENAIIKVQYVGLVKQFKSDIFILDTVASYLYNFSDLTSAMIDIKTKLYEELDYKQEFENQQTIYDLWKTHEYIHVPELIPELCTENLLSMTFIDAQGLTAFIETSTQEERNKIGTFLVEFIFTNLYKHKIFYSDIHYGNFLIKDNTYLYITDFGCLNYFDDELIDNLKNIHAAMFENDTDTFYKVVTRMGILPENVSEASKEYIWEYFRLQYSPWIEDEFEFTEEWLTKSEYKKTELMKEWLLPSNCVYLNKIPFGMYHLLTKLGVKGNFSKLIKTLL